MLCSILVLLLCLSLCLLSTPAAFAENETAQTYDDSCITGFELPDSTATVDTAYKYALIELKKEFPEKLTVYRGGVVYSQPGEDGKPGVTHVEDSSAQRIEVTWRCLEDYDEDLDVFHFVPALDGYTLADGVELPVITVNVLGRIETPPLSELPEDFHPALAAKEARASSGSRASSYYNGYELGNLPPVRNQNPYGTCWAFATIAALEADLIHDGCADRSIDLSELHLAYFTYHNFYDEKGCNDGDSVELNGADYLNCGGAPLYATMMLADMIGPNLESTVPYSLAYDYTPDAGYGRMGDMQVTGASLYSTVDREAVKDAILEHGAVITSYCSDDNYYSYSNNSYYCPTAMETNHVITLVGWDDSFPAGNFRAGTPEGNGAWLVRNSWGVDGYNYAGYFWMSYYDQSLYSSVIAIDAQTWRYDHCYAYDNSPAVWLVTFSSGPVTLCQDFTVDANEQIEAVGFYTEMAGTGVQIILTDGRKTVSTYAYIANPGYSLIPLSEPLTISQQSTVTVSYFYTDAGGNEYHSIEGDGNYSTIQFHSSAGSGLQFDGNYYEADDRRYDARLKLFTIDTSADAVDLVLPSNLTRIESEAFAGGRFASVYIPPSTKSIADDAFGSRNNLIVYGVSGSNAETFANERGFIFVPTA